MPAQVMSMNVHKVKNHKEFKIDYSKVRLLKHVDPEKRRLTGFKGFKQHFPPIPLLVKEQPRPDFGPQLGYLQNYSPEYYPKGKYIIAVNAALLPQIKGSLDQYIKDVANDGYYAVAYAMLAGTPAQVRNFLIQQSPICGVFFVGRLPVAWFEMDDDFENVHSEFPCDLYFMDLNGTWSDPDGDGKFSQHLTDVAPEIWVGRLWTPTQNGNDAALINDYFTRNHQFRKGLMGPASGALAYVDDDWQGFGQCGLDLVTGAGTVECYTDPAQTDADKYKAEIHQTRSWAQVCAHSSPYGHSFKIPSGAEWVPNSYLRDINPPNAFFYNLFACSTARFVEPDYMGGWYIFDKAESTSGGNGLVALGSTKTGSMLYFENFYRPMGLGKSVGEAFTEWWNALGSEHDLGERQWFYGLTLLGDPTLNWWSGVVPILRDPGDGDVFDHFPRETNFRWDPVSVAGATYELQWDYYCYGSGKWASETGTALVYKDLGQTSLTDTFVGAQPGRWRVRAKLGNGIFCPWTDWRYFRYTI